MWAGVNELGEADSVTSERKKNRNLIIKVKSSFLMLFQPFPGKIRCYIKVQSVASVSLYKGFAFQTTTWGQYLGFA